MGPLNNVSVLREEKRTQVTNILLLRRNSVLLNPGLGLFLKWFILHNEMLGANFAEPYLHPTDGEFGLERKLQ